jgi:glycosyltransferase involved in cell wall biosynthesis
VTGLRELVVCSLEPWDDVWRRNQFFVDALLSGNGALRVLFLEPPADPLHDLLSRRQPALPRLRRLRPDRRLLAFRPLKPLPRRLGGGSDRFILRQATWAVRAVGFARPTLWVNDLTYAPLLASTGWPSVYDVTDDWLLAPLPAREIARLTGLERIALAHADEVVVCSPALAASRGSTRTVTLVPNGVDADHFRRPRQRPADLPAGETAVYVGTLHESRLDVDLVETLARALPSVSVVLVGPDSLEPDSRRRLDAHENVRLLGARPYEDVPAYLQHADVVVVPHRVTPFTESLDPIKAYECAVVDTPTVATPVAGFREHLGAVTVASAEGFADAVRAALSRPPTPAAVTVPTWDERAAEFAAILARADGRTVGTAPTAV